MAIGVRPLTEEERLALERLAHARTEPARLVERARMVWLAVKGRRVPAIAAHLHVNENTVRLWIKRFNTRGLAGLADAPRSGRPATYSPDVVGEVIAASLTDPRTLELPFASWTLDRLQAYLHEQTTVRMRRSRISEILVAEGLRWRTQETWFGERVDPDFGQKRGPSSPSTPRRRQTASS